MTPLKESPLSVSGLREVLQRGRPCSMIRGVATDGIRLLPRPRDYGATGFMGLMELMGRISLMSPIGPIRIFRRRVA
jgi:hypothetical protein